MGRQVLRRGTRLSVELSPELLARLRQHAAAADRPVAGVVRRWIEAGLRGELEAGGADLPERVAALESAVAALQGQAADAAASTAWFRLG